MIIHSWQRLGIHVKCFQYARKGNIYKQIYHRIEWPDVYESIARWVYGLYKTRKIKYELLEKENEKK